MKLNLLFKLPRRQSRELLASLKNKRRKNDPEVLEDTCWKQILTSIGRQRWREREGKTWSEWKRRWWKDKLEGHRKWWGPRKIEFYTSMIIFRMGIWPGSRRCCIDSRSSDLRSSSPYLLLISLLRALTAAIGGMTCCKFSPDGSLIFAGTTKGTIIVFDVLSRKVRLGVSLYTLSFRIILSLEKVRESDLLSLLFAFWYSSLSVR